MKFGVREICNVVFRSNQNKKIGNRIFAKGEPVFYIDTAKTSTIEGAATSVYATGGRGNSRLITWEGEKTLTFTVEDALLSPISFSALSGAGVVKGAASGETGAYNVHFHQTTKTITESDINNTNAIIDLTDVLGTNESICAEAPVAIWLLDDDGEWKQDIAYTADTTSASYQTTYHVDSSGKKLIKNYQASFIGKNVLVDYYVIKQGASITELQIDAEHFGGSFYVEADTLFRRQVDSVDLPANITLPNVKIQSNFTFSMAATGDPSTFTFTMDAMPGYTYFNKTKKVLCAIQILDDAEGTTNDFETVFKCDAEVSSGD